MDGAALQDAAPAHAKAFEGMDAKGVLSLADSRSSMPGLEKAISTVPPSTVLDVYNSMAKFAASSGATVVLGNTVLVPPPSTSFREAAPLPALAPGTATLGAAGGRARRCDRRRGRQAFRGGLPLHAGGPLELESL